jgi:hypothetical protein
VGYSGLALARSLASAAFQAKAQRDDDPDMEQSSGG